MRVTVLRCSCQNHIVGLFSLCCCFFQPDKSVTNISNLSPPHFVSKIRHQHRIDLNWLFNNESPQFSKCISSQLITVTISINSLDTERKLRLEMYLWFYYENSFRIPSVNIYLAFEMYHLAHLWKKYMVCLMFSDNWFILPLTSRIIGNSIKRFNTHSCYNSFCQRFLNFLVLTHFNNFQILVYNLYQHFFYVLI